MKKKTAIVVAAAVTAAATAEMEAQRFRHIAIPKVKVEVVEALPEPADTVVLPRSVERILAETELPPRRYKSVNLTFGPWIFSGYRRLGSKQFNVDVSQIPIGKLWELVPSPYLSDSTALMREAEETLPLLNADESMNTLDWNSGKEPAAVAPESSLLLAEDVTPLWLRQALTASRIEQDFMYRTMLDDYRTIDYAYWDLPVPPRLPEDDYSFRGYVKSLNLPEIDLTKALIPDIQIEKKHWLHVFSTGLQFSEAYLSNNWYQGGHGYLSLLFNFYWDVQLNRVFHPNTMFESTLSYKLGLNSVHEDKYHKYSISEDLFQYNLKTGFKAFRNWFYSYTLQFKTQLCNYYPSNSETLTAAFLSPADLNMGIGMTYAKENQKKTLQFNASISPISYNLHMCVNQDVNPTLYNLKEGQRFKNEIGSNAEITFNWKMTDVVSYKTRLFLFTDYSYFLGDWQNTLNFQFSRLFSSQLYVNLRYDTTSDELVAPKWRHWMLKEIFSIGLTYNFSTKIKK